MFRLRSIARSAGILLLAFSWAHAQAGMGQDAMNRAPTSIRITRAALDVGGGAMAGPGHLRLRSTSLGFTFQTRLSTGRLRLTPGFVQRATMNRVQPLAGDFSGDGAVDFDDFFLFASAFGSRDAKFDLSRDGRVDFDDFFLFAAQFGKRR